jgi:heptosyltransferase-2
VTHLVILAPNWLGDAVMALPAIADVHRASPDTRLIVAARTAIAPLFKLVPHVHDVMALGGDRRRDDSVVLRDSGADTALLLPNSFHAALTVSRAAIPERWGYRTEWRGFLLTRAIERAPEGVHQIDYYQRLVHALGYSNGPIEPHLDVPPASRAAGAVALVGAGWDNRAPLVALAPGAAYGGAKRWPPDRFAELAEALAADGVVTVLVGSVADVATGEEVEAHLGARARTLNLIGRTDLPLLGGVLVNCRALVSNDSGAMHLAAAAGVRVTAVFGPTDENVTGPRGLHAVVSHPVWCRPCLLRECPLDHECMRGVRVAAVLDQARQTL